MKKLISVILSLVMLTAVLSACGEDHTHSDDPWTVTVDGHYQICEESGETINEGKHDTDDNHVCKSCGARLAAYSPSELSITVYNKLGLTEYYTEYRNGKETYRRVYEYVYDGDIPVSFKSYVGSDPYDEGNIVSEDGEYARQRLKRYYEDSYQIRTYTEDGDLATRKEYDKNGKLLESLTYTYEKNADGALVTCTVYAFDQIAELEEYQSDENGKDYLYRFTNYDSNGKIESVSLYGSNGYLEEYVRYKNGKTYYTQTYEYRFDEEGELLSEKVFVDDALSHEYTYRYADYPYASSKTIRYESAYYSPNGDLYVDTYDAYGREILSKTIAADGTVLREVETEYTLDALGRVTAEKQFKDGTLTEESVYEYEDDAEDWTKLTETDYDDDGEKQVTVYSENYDELSYTEYDAEGEIVYAETYEYEYDENGNILVKKTFEDGTLTEESVYEYEDDAEDWTKLTETDYDDDGEKQVTVYNENYDELSYTEYDAEGEIVYAETYEYEYDENGNILVKKTFEDGTLTEESVYEYEDDAEDWTKLTETDYDDDGEKQVTVYNENYDELSYTEYDTEGEIVCAETYEYEYDENGNILVKKFFEDGKPVGETRYTYDENGDTALVQEYEDGVLVETRTYSLRTTGGTYSSNVTSYYPDGGKRSIDYSETGSIELDVQYDADGNYVHYFKYTQVTNDDGTQTVYTHDENNRLIHESHRDKNGNMLQFIEHSTDGGKHIIFYDENAYKSRSCWYDKDGNLTSDILYNEEGNVITETQYTADGKTVYTHNDDGTVTRELFDRSGNLIEIETV